MLELPADIEDGLRERAARHGQDVTDYLRQILGEPGGNGERHEPAGDTGRPRESDPAYLLSLPLEERRRIMAAQFDEAAPLYAADLALPMEQRELTAFTALDGDPVMEEHHSDQPRSW